MTHAHICDECKKVAPVDENLGWWDVAAAYTSIGAMLKMTEKAEYHFCSWPCMAAFSKRMSGAEA